MPMLNWLHRSANPWRLLVVAAICGALRYVLMPSMGASLMSAPDAGPLGLMFAYTPTEAFAHDDF